MTNRIVHYELRVCSEKCVYWKNGRCQNSGKSVAPAIPNRVDRPGQTPFPEFCQLEEVNDD